MGERLYLNSSTAVYMDGQLTSLLCLGKSYYYEDPLKFRSLYWLKGYLMHKITIDNEGSCYTRKQDRIIDTEDDYEEAVDYLNNIQNGAFGEIVKMRLFEFLKFIEIYYDDYRDLYDEEHLDRLKSEVTTFTSQLDLDEIVMLEYGG